MAKADKQSSYNFIDLFAGAGGLSEGFIQAGFRPVAHVEMNEYAAKTLETRSAYYYLKNSGNLALYGKYLSGDISRDELMKMIPASVTKTVINETLSDETLPPIAILCLATENRTQDAGHARFNISTKNKTESAQEFGRYLGIGIAIVLSFPSAAGCSRRIRFWAASREYTGTAGWCLFSSGRSYGAVSAGNQQPMLRKNGAEIA